MDESAARALSGNPGNTIVGPPVHRTGSFTKCPAVVNNCNDAPPEHSNIGIHIFCLLAVISVNVTDAGDLSNPVCTTDSPGVPNDFYKETRVSTLGYCHMDEETVLMT